MLKLSKTQFSRAIEDSQLQPSQEASRVSVDLTPAGSDGGDFETVPRPRTQPRQNQSRRTSTVLLTALIVVIGIGAGWIGGKLLNSRSQSASAAPPVDLPADDPAAASQPQPDSHRTNRAATPEKSSTPSKPGPEEEQPAVTAESRAKEAESKEAEAKETPKETAKETPKDTSKKPSKETPPEVPRVEKGDEDKPDDPAKEVNRQALKELTKEGKKPKRGWGNKGWGNKNGNEDLQ